MASELNFFDTYVLMAITEEIVPQQTFFKDRYFPTGEGDIFACDKVLTEYRSVNGRIQSGLYGSQSSGNAAVLSVFSKLS